MKVLVTGAFGNIGSHAVPALMKAGHQVRCLSHRARHDERVSRAKFNGPVQMVYGDIRRVVDLKDAVEGVDAVVHLAYVIPPSVDEDRVYAHEVNVVGTENLLTQIRRQRKPPKLLFASTFDVFGYTQHLTPPRRLTDPVAATDLYTHQKIINEAAVMASGLPYSIFRFADVPPIALRTPHPVMYRIPLETRIETLHPDDAGLAIANGIASDAIWGHTWLIGGGARCQLKYRQYLNTFLELFGIGSLPENLFSEEPYPTDWIDSTESQALLHYQRHSFDDIVRDCAALLGWRRPFMRIFRPWIRSQIIGLAPHGHHDHADDAGHDAQRHDTGDTGHDDHPQTATH